MQSACMCRPFFKKKMNVTKDFFIFLFFIIYFMLDEKQKTKKKCTRSLWTRKNLSRLSSKGPCLALEPSTHPTSHVRVFGSEPSFCPPPPPAITASNLYIHS